MRNKKHLIYALLFLIISLAFFVSLFSTSIIKNEQFKRIISFQQNILTGKNIFNLLFNEESKSPSQDSSGGSSKYSPQGGDSVNSFTEEFNDGSNIASMTNMKIENSAIMPISYPSKEFTKPSTLLLHFNSNLKDSSGKSNKISCEGSCIFTKAGKFYDAVKMSPSNKIKISPSTELKNALSSSGKGFTMSFWLKPLDGDKDAVDIYDGRDWSHTVFRLDTGWPSNNKRNLALYIGYLDTEGHQKTATITTPESGSPMIDSKRWNNIALVYDKQNSRLSIYINGKKAGLYSPHLPVEKGDIVIKRPSFDINQNGIVIVSQDNSYLDDLFVLDYPMSESEIISLGNSPQYFASFTSKPIGNEQMFSLHASWEGPEEGTTLEVSTDSGKTWCSVDNNKDLSPKSKCFPMGKSFIYRMLFDGGNVHQGIGKVYFEWQNTNPDTRVSNLKAKLIPGSYSAATIEFETDKAVQATLEYRQGSSWQWKKIKKPDYQTHFLFVVEGLVPGETVVYKLVLADKFNKINTYQYSFDAGKKPPSTIASISEEPIKGQSKDKRIGSQIRVDYGHWKRAVYQNFLENPGMDHWRTENGNQIALGWYYSFNNVVASIDKKEKVNGIGSQKLVFSSNGRANLHEYIMLTLEKGRNFRLRCKMKQENFDGTVVFSSRKGTPSCQFISAPKKIPSQWGWVGFDFVATKTCSGDDGRYFDTGLTLQGSRGTVWIDDCEFYDLDDRDDWGISQKAVESFVNIRPATVREGALGMNTVIFSNLVGNPYETEPRIDCRSGSHEKDKVLGVNELFKYAELTGSNPEIVIPWTFSEEDARNLMEYLFGDKSTKWGAEREKDGYESWAGKFDKIVFELGNELTFWLGSISCYTSSGGSVPSDVYGKWAGKMAKALEESGYWDSEAMETGFNMQYTNTWGHGIILKNEPNKIVDFATVGNYLPEHRQWRENTKSHYYSPEEMKANPDKYFRTAMGHSIWTEKYIHYMRDVARTYYGKNLNIGIYEYGVGEDYSRNSDVLWDLEVSKSAASAVMDTSLNAIKHGIDTQNYYLGQVALSSSRSFLSDYPYSGKRPLYYLFEMYGKYVRGDMIKTELKRYPVFDPWGPEGDKIEAAKVENRVYNLEKNVPQTAFYAFKKGGRYSYVIINRNVHDKLDFQFNIQTYNPSPIAEFFYLTGGPYDTNDFPQTNKDWETFTKKDVHLEHKTITTFKKDYKFTLEPGSMYVIVNYALGEKVCLDEDGDGYSANQYEKKDCPKKEVDCADFNPNIHPENSNADCDCDFSDRASRGRREIKDGKDNDCDGKVDEFSGGGSFECTSDLDCHSPNPCKEGFCISGECSYKNKADGTSCEDGNACTLNDQCSAGVCQAGQTKDCSDDYSCTADSCNTDTGKCTHYRMDEKCPSGQTCNPDLYSAPSGCGGGGISKDSDNDGVPDSKDKCAKTPAGVKVNKFGCPFPKKFQRFLPARSTNLNEVDLNSVKDFTIGTADGQIKLLGEVSLLFEKDGYLRPIDLGEDVVSIEKNKISINPEKSGKPAIFNRKAELTFDNHGLKHPAPFMNGAFCKECKILASSDSEFVLEIPHFSIVELKESTCGDGYCDSDVEDCSSCEADCGLCTACIDEDADGYSPSGGSCGEVDCDDTNKDIHPRAKEVCGNSKDDDCDGQTDEGCSGGSGRKSSSRSSSQNSKGFCGDKKCDSSIGEDCSNCLIDCGACSSNITGVNFVKINLDEREKWNIGILNTGIINLTFKNKIYSLALLNKNGTFLLFKNNSYSLVKGKIIKLDLDEVSGKDVVIKIEDLSNSKVFLTIEKVLVLNNLLLKRSKETNLLWVVLAALFIGFIVFLAIYILRKILKKQKSKQKNKNPN